MSMCHHCVWYMQMALCRQVQSTIQWYAFRCWSKRQDLQYKVNPTQNDYKFLKHSLETVCKTDASWCWLALYSKIQDAEDPGNTGKMYEVIKQAVGPVVVSSASIKFKSNSVLTFTRYTATAWPQAGISVSGLKFLKTPCVLSSPTAL